LARIDEAQLRVWANAIGQRMREWVQFRPKP
jgi:hypothetical protein